MRTFFFLAMLVSIAACNHQELPYYHSADFTPLWDSEQKFSHDTLHTIAPFQFTDQLKQSVTNESVKGKIYVANFFFTACPSICPKMTNQLLKVHKTFSERDDILILSHSVMPWADSVSRLKDYAEVNQIDNNRWKLLTGKQSEIYDLARRSYFAEEVAGFKRDSTDFVHTEHCLLVDRDGHLRGIYNGTVELEMDRLIEDIRVLLK